ncbi:uncharacterized protein LOC124386372 [Silurus meridionalis]|uniref:Uncharacterized protein n=1 Tax=Silurus meridionalis TaxID=175797 RepID=A0A8T0BLF3_SILME|nr:uncharacterized protein LOC124386372 [Silurus meridionalis]KAF7707023.1 hypothetical protein HF521_018241 [Silurus meridionalis]
MVSMVTRGDPPQQCASTLSLYSPGARSRWLIEEMNRKDWRTEPAHQETGQILFSGPDGIGNYRVRQYDFHNSIGIVDLPAEATGDLNYLFRPASGAPPPLPRHCYVGEVGWGIMYGFQLNARTLLSNHQLKRSVFCSDMEDISNIPQKLPACFVDSQEPKCLKGGLMRTLARTTS